MTSQYDLTGIHGADHFRTLAEGLKLRLNDGTIAEIVANPGDAAYVLAEILECPRDASRVGSEEAIYFADVERVIEPNGSAQ